MNLPLYSEGTVLLASVSFDPATKKETINCQPTSRAAFSFWNLITRTCAEQELLNRSRSYIPAVIFHGEKKRVQNLRSRHGSGSFVKIYWANLFSTQRCSNTYDATQCGHDIKSETLGTD